MIGRELITSWLHEEVDLLPVKRILAKSIDIEKSCLDPEIDMFFIIQLVLKFQVRNLTHIDSSVAQHYCLTGLLAKFLNIFKRGDFKPKRDIFVWNNNEQDWWVGILLHRQPSECSEHLFYIEVNFLCWSKIWHCPFYTGGESCEKHFSWEGPLVN